MRHSKHRFVFVVFVLSVLLWTVESRPAAAEWFLDLEAGGARTQDDNIDIGGSNHEGGPSTPVTKTDAELANSVSAGLRVGYWLESAPMLGLALTASYYEPGVTNASVGGVRQDDIEQLDLKVVPLTVLFMARTWLWESKEFPHGRLQPYVGIGGGGFFTEFSGPGVSSTDEQWGIDARVGLTAMITRNIGVFGEYRFTQTSPTFESQHQPRVEFSLYSHHALGGLTYRFD